MLKDKETSQLVEEALRNDSSSLKGDILKEYKHPAVDTKAKWKLKNLFNTVISIPGYLKSNVST